MLHGCPPSPDAWGRLNVVTPFHHLSGDSHINSSLREGPLRHLTPAVAEKVVKWVDQIRSGDVPGTSCPGQLGRQVDSAAVEADVSKIDPAKLLAALKRLAA